MHYKSIDILKGIAMIMVILIHYSQSFDYHWLFGYLQHGCSIFFVCSGFGIISLIYKKYPDLLENKLNILSFYYSRFKSLAVGWYLSFIFIFLVNTLMILLVGHTLKFGSNREPLSIAINLLFFNGLFPRCFNNVMPGGWYIGTTVILYGLTPLIFKMLNDAKNKKCFFVFSSTVCLIVWVCLKKYFDNFSYNGFDECFFLIRYPEYLLGMILYYDLKQSNLNEKQIYLCVPSSIYMFLIAIILFNVSFPLSGTFSRYFTALGTYLILYYMMALEQQNMLPTRLGGGTC